MRVIAGEFRSRRLLSVPGMDTRPTPDKLRQTLFNILGERVEGGVFLDAYAGTGAVGIEALSRGARHAIFIEKHAGAVQIIRANLASLGLESRSTVLKGNSAVREAELRLADIVFIDPPYTQEREYSAMFDLLAVVAPPLTVVQHPIRLRLPETAGRLSSTRLVKQGDNALSFYVRSD
jgi:16S rRNA (guanine966-N2)-methyltransferase